MPKVSVYLPDDLYRAARDNQLPLSSLAQRAIEEALQARLVDRWVERAATRAPRTHRLIDVHAALDAAREEFGA